MESAVMEIQYRRNDGSFVAIVNGNPYHIIPDDPLFLEAEALGQDAPFEPELVEPPPTREQQEAARQAAYSAEADPIAMQMLRDEATKEEWLAKIDEIKARYPYPEDEE
jgi:hypothetical protein